MALGTVIKMEFCRLCQCHLGKIPVQCDSELINKIADVTKIQVNDELNTYLPACICVSCMNMIVETYNFIQTVQRVDKNLRTATKNKLYNNVCGNSSPTENNDCEEKPQDISIKCDKCFATFPDNSLLQTHLNSHIDIVNLKCPMCSKSYNRTSSYNSHKKTHSELYCNNCNQIFESQFDCINHKCKIPVKKENNHANNVRKTCKRTKPKIIIKSEVLQLSQLPKEGASFECSTCSKSFNNKRRLRVHLNVHKKFTCTEENCDKELPSARALKVHQLNHQGKKPYLCIKCGKGFTTRNSLTCHEKIHAEVKDYRCDLCNISFSVRSNLRAHEKKYHEGVRFYCSQCTKEFLTKCSLDRHEKIHAGVKEFKCGHCTSAFYTSKELLKHQRYHLGLRLYKCEECFKTFFERSHLTVHMRMHSGERPYVCKVSGCGKSFAESQKLKRHHTSKHSSIS